MPLPPGWTLTTPPTAATVISLATAKDHCRVDQDDTDHDSVLEIYIAAAVDDVERRLGRALLRQTWTASFDSLAADGSLIVVRGPLPAVQNMKALVSGAYQTLDPSTYVVRPLAGRDVLKIARPMAATTPWPIADRDPAAWTVDVAVGWANVAAIPFPIIAAMLLIIGDLFTNRDAKVAANLVENSAVDALLSPHRAATL